MKNKNKTKKIVLVTGGSGFIGSNLVDLLLKKNFHVICIDNLSTGNKENIKHLKTNKNFFFVKADINNIKKIDKYFKNVLYVFHLAALADIVPSIQNPTNYFESNVKGTLNICKLCVKYKVKKILYSASSSCYGIPNKYPTKENEKISPQYPYALTKKMGEDIIIHWANVYKLNYISLRLFNVYGLRSRTSGTYGAVFGVFLRQKISNKPLTVVGDGEQTRDFTYVSDICSAFFMSAISSVNNEVFNVGSGNHYSINKIVSLLNSKKIHIPKRPGEPDCTFADISKIKKSIGWKPVIKLEEGIKLLLSNLSYWRKAPLWNKASISIATKDWFKYLK